MEYIAIMKTDSIDSLKLGFCVEGNYFICTNNTKTFKIVDKFNGIFKLSDAVDMVNEHYDSEMQKIDMQMKSLEQFNKEESNTKRISDLIERTKICGKRMSESSNIGDFYNYLHEISMLKKQIYQGRDDEVSYIRKRIGTIKYLKRENDRKRISNLSFLKED